MSRLIKKKRAVEKWGELNGIIETNEYGEIVKT